MQPVTWTGEGPTGLERPVAVLLLAVWFGLLSGLAQVALFAFEKVFLHEYVQQSPHVAWMAPTTDLLIFAISGLALSLIARRWPGLIRLRLTASVFVFLSAFSLLLLVKSLHRYAALILAAGLAFQSARFIASRPDRFGSLVRRSLRWMVAVVVGLAVGVQGWQALAQRRELAELPPAPLQAPNVLLIVLDTVRAQSLSLYRHTRETTPQLERLAKTAVRFEQAIAPAPWTLPSHASMFTGRLPHEVSASSRSPLDTTYPTLAEFLRTRGYLTAGFVANTTYCSVESGLARGFIYYEDYLISPGQILISSSLGRLIVRSRLLFGFLDHRKLGRKTAPDVNRSFLRWLSGMERRPFFAFLNYMDAHHPYMAPAPFNQRFEPKRGRKPSRRLLKRKVSPLEVQDQLNAYEGSIAYLDSQIGLLFDELQHRGILGNTLVIITSDHGEEFGEHGLLRHGYSLYRPVLQVPLLISFPSRLPAGKSVREPVSLRDLPATIADLIGLDHDVPFPGRSLTRFWGPGRVGGAAQTDLAVSEVEQMTWKPKWYPVYKGPMKSLADGRYHYIRNGDGREELYDFENDPWEQRDLAGTDEARQALTRFRTALQTILARNR